MKLYFWLFVNYKKDKWAKRLLTYMIAYNLASRYILFEALSSQKTWGKTFRGW